MLWVSRQVIREFLVARSRPQTFAEPSSPKELVERVRFIEAHFRVADEDAAVTTQLLDLLQRYAVGGKQVHDANVVATMRVHGVRRLLTHNVEDFRRFEPEIEVVSLVAA